MTPRQLVWALLAAELALIAISALCGYQFCCWRHRTPITMVDQVRFTAKQLRDGAGDIDRFDNISTPEITDTMRVMAHWLEHAIGDQPDGDGSKERIHKPYQRLLPSRVP